MLELLLFNVTINDGNGTAAPVYVAVAMTTTVFFTVSEFIKPLYREGNYAKIWQRAKNCLFCNRNQNMRHGYIIINYKSVYICKYTICFIDSVNTRLCSVSQ